MANTLDSRQQCLGEAQGNTATFFSVILEHIRLSPSLLAYLRRVLLPHRLPGVRYIPK